MSNLVNHVLMNKLDDELNEAIKEVGGDTSGATGPWDYPAIIKEQLGAKGSCGGEISIDLKAGPGIIIKEIEGQKFICGTSGVLTTGALNPPSGSYKQPVSEVIEAGTPVQEVFEALFYKILPKMSSVYKGDIIIAGEDGTDKYNEEDFRTGLIPLAHYLRIYVANRQEPVYICLSGHGIINSESGNGSIGGGSVITPPSQAIKYKGGESEYISVSVVEDTITATLNQAGVDLFKKINSIEQITDRFEGDIRDLKSQVTNAVTQQQVEAVVENAVEEKVNNVFQSEVVDAKVREQILEALTDEGDNDIKTAFENVVSNVLSDSTAETSDMVDDIFSDIFPEI